MVKKNNVTPVKYAHTNSMAIVDNILGLSVVIMEKKVFYL